MPQKPKHRDLRSIMKFDGSNAHRPAGEATYKVEFAHDDVSLATFTATTPIPVPTEGSTVVVHLQPVRVVRVEQSYEWYEGKDPRFYTEVEVAPIEEG